MGKGLGSAPREPRPAPPFGDRWHHPKGSLDVTRVGHNHLPNPHHDATALGVLRSMERASPRPHIWVAKSPLCPPNWAPAPHAGLSPGWHPHGTHKHGAEWGVLSHQLQVMAMLLGSREGGPGPPRPRTEDPFVLPPGPVVYLQPELLTSATGPDLRHRHTDMGPPSPAAPPGPQVPPGLCWGRRGHIGHRLPGKEPLPPERKRLLPGIQGITQLHQLFARADPGFHWQLRF